MPEIVESGREKEASDNEINKKDPKEMRKPPYVILRGQQTPDPAEYKDLSGTGARGGSLQEQIFYSSINGGQATTATVAGDILATQIFGG